MRTRIDANVHIYIYISYIHVRYIYIDVYKHTYIYTHMRIHRCYIWQLVSATGRELHSVDFDLRRWAVLGRDVGGRL